jgi:hypothetical protein
LIGEKGCLAMAVVVRLCNEGGDMGCDLSLLVSLGVEEKQRKSSSFDGDLVWLNSWIVDGGNLLLDCEQRDDAISVVDPTTPFTKINRDRK